MDGRHEFLLSTVAERLGMAYDEVEEFMLEGNQVGHNNIYPHRNYASNYFMNSWITLTTSLPSMAKMHLYFFIKLKKSLIQKKKVLLKKSSDLIQGTFHCLIIIEVEKEKRLWITDGTRDAYPGCCLFFVRLNPNKAITNLNIHQVKITL